ncbi:hypothetical protein SAMN04488094_108150 [Tropicimonas isoalkanivorans]|uniref:Sulfotransferase family protein n=2 Tax=Tropicimonas isoalkanivorans TaxID=441112 RepID=A0A1I1LRX7_9RHOB|nr:hypothetical protein SAMN04488094_108150 [Tropicimonas isoalkanivorans]
MKVIIYIGHHKVGSTALQTYLSRNWLKLIRDGGILYPMVEFEGMANCLARAMAGKDDDGDLTLNEREPHNTLVFKMIAEAGGFKLPAFIDRPPAVFQMARAIREQIDNLSPRAVVLCSEVMSNFGHESPALTQQLRSFFPGASFEIYLTLRRPDEYLASWHGQRFRFGYRWGRLEGEVAKKYIHTVHFDYQTLLQPWTEAFPDAVFHIRNYSDVLAVGGSCEDFVQQVGIDFPSGLVPAPRANKSIPYAFYDIMRRANQELDRPDAERFMHFLESTNIAKEVHKNAEVEVLGQGARTFLADAFEPIHSYVGQVANRSPFFPDIDEMRIAHPVPEEVASRAALELLLELPERARPQPPAWELLRKLAAGH